MGLLSRGSVQSYFYLFEGLGINSRIHNDRPRPPGRQPTASTPGMGPAVVCPFAAGITAWLFPPIAQRCHTKGGRMNKPELFILHPSLLILHPFSCQLFESGGGAGFSSPGRAQPRRRERPRAGRRGAR